MKRCKTCKQPFAPRQPMAVCCSWECASAFAVSKRLKAERREQIAEKRADKVKRDRLKTPAQLAKDAEREVNRYVRARDAADGCISCNKPATWDGQWHASHFRSVGAARHLRFNLWNIHKACSICNNWKSGNLGEYAPRLRAKIGDKKVEWLLSNNAVVKYNADYFLRVKRVFSRKARRQEMKNASIGR